VGNVKVRARRIPLRIPVIGEHIGQTFSVNTARGFGKRGYDSESLLEHQVLDNFLEQKSIQFNGQISKWSDGFLGEDDDLFTILTGDFEESLQEPKGRSHLLNLATGLWNQISKVFQIILLAALLFRKC